MNVPLRLVDALETPVVRLDQSLDASTVAAALALVVVVDLVVALSLRRRSAAAPAT